MELVIDIPKSLYANLQKIQNGSIAAKRILECVRNGKSVMYYPQVEGITPTVVEPNTDCVSRQYLIEKAVSWDKHFADGIRYVALTDILNAPSVTPRHTDAEIQKMQEMEQAEMQKAYELGKAEMQLSEDAISRQAVLDIDFKRIILTTAKPAEMIEKKVKALPPVTPQPKVGYWIDRFPLKECKCSVCDYLICISSGSYLDMAKNMKFCPNCGAKMESQTNCSTCILDNTDACTRGAGRAVDDEACDDYLASPTGAESEG